MLPWKLLQLPESEDRYKIMATKQEGDPLVVQCLQELADSAEFYHKICCPMLVNIVHYTVGRCEIFLMHCRRMGRLLQGA